MPSSGKFALFTTGLPKKDVEKGDCSSASMPLRMLKLRRAQKTDRLSDESSKSALSDEAAASTLSAKETYLIVDSWQRARLSSDLGADLAARLLNDKRSQFRTLLQQRAKCRVSMDDNQLFTVEIIKNSYPEAAAVGSGMVAFFDKLLASLKNPAHTETELAVICKELGALHYKKKVWFLAENWLSVKRLRFRRRSRTRSQVNNDDKAEADKPHRKECPEETAWFKLLQSVVRNMKQGFLEVR
uniref:Globin family profile domain-containing protein n=1 Tax=Parascaris univalens TaxID=6257 RepID=A0A914ZLQ9_PARUN